LVVTKLSGFVKY